jgi:beta-lactamase class A
MSQQELSLRDLLTLMIIVSDNTATNLAIESLGMNRINALAKELGLTGTIFQRKMLDFEARARDLDNFTTAKDTARILETILDGSLTGPELKDKMMEILRNQQFNHKLPARFARTTPGDPVLAHKTGELPGTEHDAGILETEKSPVIIVVLTNKLENNLAGQTAIARIGELISYGQPHDRTSRQGAVSG